MKNFLNFTMVQSIHMDMLILVKYVYKLVRVGFLHQKKIDIFNFYATQKILNYFL